MYRGDNTEIEQRHLRIVVRDLDATVAWWSKLGFTLTHNAFHAPDGGLWAGSSDHSVSGEAAMVATDETSFALIFETWDGPAPVGPSYGAPIHQGLYRMAMAVDDVQRRGGSWSMRAWRYSRRTHSRCLARRASSQPFRFSDLEATCRARMIAMASVEPGSAP